MSITETIKKRVQATSRGKPLTTKQFLKVGSRSAVDKALSRLVSEGVIKRVSRGVYVRPKPGRFTKSVMPNAAEIVRAIAKKHGETIQVHGAEAARRFRLSTQVPMVPVYYTSGSTREVKIGNLAVKLTHASHRRLQHAGKKPGMALSALWYLGKENVDARTVEAIRKELSPTEFETLRNSDMPAWMTEALNRFAPEAEHG